MRLAIIFVIRGNFEKYHQRLVKEIGKKFNQQELLKEPKLPSHFCMKFPFDTTKVKEIERIIKKIANKHTIFNLKVGKFGHFTDKVVFAKPRYSRELMELQKELIRKLRVHKQLYDLDWVPHATISFCKNNQNYKKIWRYLKQKGEKEFNVVFDNISILRKYSEKDWRVYKEFKLKNNFGETDKLSEGRRNLKINL